MLNGAVNGFHFKLGLLHCLLYSKVDVRPLNFFNFDEGIFEIDWVVIFGTLPIFLFFERVRSGDGGEFFDVAL